MQKEIIILGGIGNTERQNRDDKRVLSGGGYNLHSEICAVCKVKIDENNNSTKGETVKPKENRIRQSNPKGL